MEAVHVRCAGLGISVKDAKVCVRIAGAGRRKTIETVTTWSSMTNQILALREPLAAELETAVLGHGTAKRLNDCFLSKVQLSFPSPKSALLRNGRNQLRSTASTDSIGPAGMANFPPRGH